MRRTATVSMLVALLLALGALPAAAQGQPEHFFYEPAGMEFAAGAVCVFGVIVETLRGRVHDSVRELDDGTIHIRTTGSWHARLTNTETGESIVRNLSGPLDLWIFPDGTARAVNRGHTLAWLLPEEGGPALWHHRGTIEWSIDEAGLFSVVRETGIREDLCSALS